MKRPSIPQAIAITVVVVLLCTAGVLYWQHRRASDEWRQLVAGPPLSLDVDLSKPGRHAVPYLRTYSFPHGEALYLDVGPCSIADSPVTRLLAGLEATVEIFDSSGEAILSAELSGDDLASHPASGPKLFLLFGLPGTAGDGAYSMRVTVTEGAEGLAGLKHGFMAKPHLCGTERLHVIAPLLNAIMAAVVAIVISAILAVLTIRRRRAALSTGSRSQSHL